MCDLKCSIYIPGLGEEMGGEGGVPGSAYYSAVRQCASPRSNYDGDRERFSRKVFVGGLPPDIDEDEITASFRRFGPLVVDWPHKAESKSYFPPKGYAFLLFQVKNRSSFVQNLTKFNSS